MNEKAKCMIGIDPGVNTGLCVYDRETKIIYTCETVKIHYAMNAVLDAWRVYDKNIFVRLEDARLRNWFGHKTIGKDQGAGSIKRDCTIWEDFLTDNAIPFQLVDPKHVITKMSAEQFALVTGYKKRTSSHARDAAMLVYGF